MSKALEYGDIVTLKTETQFWRAGQEMYILAPEGDGDLGLREHAVCFKLGEDGKPNKQAGAYEVPWTDIDFSTIRDSAEVSLKAKVETLDKQIKDAKVKKDQAEKMYLNIKRDHSSFINSFAKEIE